MEEQLLPIVPFGKYKNKSVIELLADKNYVEWLTQQSWFSKKKQIYNIVVNQTNSAITNSKTPEHNKLQNLFLDKCNQVKLLSLLFKNNLINKINQLFEDEDIIRCFGKHDVIPEFINKVDNTTIMFEEKFNWDFVLYYNDYQNITFVSNVETEIFDKKEYKKIYDMEHLEKYENDLLLFDKVIESRINFDEDHFDEDKKQYQDQLRFKFMKDQSKYMEVEVSSSDGKLFELLDKCYKVNNIDVCNRKYCCFDNTYNLYTVSMLNKKKEDYKKKYENKFNKHYDTYRLQYYYDIIKKYYDKQEYNPNKYERKICVEKINENQYEIIMNICDYENAVCCELKPTLSDDYPVVLRKLKTQIELTKNYNNPTSRGSKFEDFNNKKYILIIGSFTSLHVSKEQLITIFNQSNIKVIFTNEIFKTSSSVVIKSVNTVTNVEQVLFENELIKKNKILKDSLSQTQQQLLEAEQKIKQLEEEILLFKSKNHHKSTSKKHNKSIKDYFENQRRRE